MSTKRNCSHFLFLGGGGRGGRLIWEAKKRRVSCVVTQNRNGNGCGSGMEVEKTHIYKASYLMLRRKSQNEDLKLNTYFSLLFLYFYFKFTWLQRRGDIRDPYLFELLII